MFSFYLPGREARAHKKMLIAELSKTDEWLIESNNSYGHSCLIHGSGLEITLDTNWKSISILPAKVDIGEAGERAVYFEAQELLARLMNKGLGEGDVSEVTFKKK